MPAFGHLPDFTHYDLPESDNIGFGALERLGDRAALYRGAERAGATAIIDDLALGWDTVLSRRYPGGVDLSGGQWQRMALARALVAVDDGAGLLILDEPTAALDVRAEAAFYDRFLELCREEPVLAGGAPGPPRRRRGQRQQQCGAV